jgi:PQQ-dependent dehydrogenase (methanol/ethanol family)
MSDHHASPFRFASWIVGAATAIGLAGCSLESGTADAEWAIIGGGSDQHYFSKIDQIDETNVSRLGLAWQVEMPTKDGLVGNPLVVDGVIYQAGPPGKIYANDLATGKELWTFTPEFEYSDDTSWTGFWGTHFNRGLAVDGDLLYVGAYCRLAAVDRHTHKQVWAVPSCDSTKMQAITGAPRVGGGKVFIGNSSGDNGQNRGFVDAFDTKTGMHLWRFYTMPGDPSKPFENEILAKAAKTWGTDYWKYTQGGVSPWDAITYDEKTDTLYFGTDGPVPYAPTQRAPDADDELFTDSIIAVNASTGAYKWHFQTVQHDGWNLSATMHIMLADLPGKDGNRRVVMTAPKNGYFYVLDAETGKFIGGNNFTPVNWAKGLDPKTGRAIVSGEANYWEHPGKAVVVLPSEAGGHSWQAMAYNPKHHLVYIPSIIAPMTMTLDPNGLGGAHSDYTYGFKPGAIEKTRGELVAWDPVTNQAKWRVNRSIAMNGGVLATAGNLVFQGTGEGFLEAYAADTGKKIWSFDVGGCIMAAPTSVAMKGVQYLIVASGNCGTSAMRVIPRLINTPSSQAPARLLAFRLDGTAKLPANRPITYPRPALDRPAAQRLALGRSLFASNGCGGCHGYDAIGIANAHIPDLRWMTKETADAMHAIVVEGAYKPAGMPAFPQMTDKELQAVREFISAQAWSEYDRQGKR